MFNSFRGNSKNYENPLIASPLWIGLSRSIRMWVWIKSMLLVRDSMSEVLIILSALKHHIIESDIAKAMTVLWVVNFAQELRFFRVALEGDAL